VPEWLSGVGRGIGDTLHVAHFTCMPRNPDWTRDELILALDLYMRSGRTQLPQTHPQIIELSTVLNALPLHAGIERDIDFRNANGVSMKLADFRSADPQYGGIGLSRGNRLERVVWAEFADDLYKLRATAEAIRAMATNRVADARASYAKGSEDEEFPEGKILTRLHKQKERNRKAVEKKKASVLASAGKLRCEACDFDFVHAYGELGRSFAECHHRVPLCDLSKIATTRLSDLAIVCSNCHRMLHRSRPLLTVEALRSLVLAQRQRSTVASA
jgi:5-methylcytosine-specific restriction protein A